LAKKWESFKQFLNCLEVILSNIEIRPVQSKKDLQNFIKFQWKINENDPNWVAPLMMDRLKVLNKETNPFFKDNPAEFFLAYKNSEVVGRIAAIINHQHNKFHEDKTGFFGFLEAENDKEIFSSLLDTVEKWLKEKNYDSIMGPMNPSTNDEVGFLIDGFDSPPYFMMTHNPPYYNEIMTALGFEKAKDLYAYYIHKNDLNLERVNQLSESMKKKFSVSIRIINLKKFQNELKVIREIYNDAWSKNWGFVPMTPEEFDFVANDFRKIIDPELVMIAEYKGKPIGFSLALPNYNEVFKKIPNGKLLPFGIFTFLFNKNKIKSLRAITLGVTKDYQTSGIGGMLILETILRGLSAGYDSAEMSWVLEDNELMNKGATLVGGKIYKTYRVYQKSI
jgi:hypothetical protein